MKNRILVSVVTLGFTALLFTGCSKVPQAEIDAANLAITEATAAGAELYAPEAFVSLQDSMNSAMVLIEAQKSKMFANYSTAKENLVSVAQYAQEVKVQAETRKEEMKTEIQNTIAEVKTMIETNRQLISQAPRGKEGTTALLAIKDEVNTIETTVNEVVSMFEQGDYIGSLDKIKAAKEKSASINAELTQVIEKYKANVKARK